jgi:hypothetical protein
MGERFDNTFRLKLALGLGACGLGFAAALLLLSSGSILDGCIVAGVSYFAFRWFWRSTIRKRALLRQGYHVGGRAGAHWVYEELRDGIIESIELPLDYVGRGEYDIHVPSERDWSTSMPAWARARRAEIVERLQTVFKRSQILFDPDAPTTPPDA